MGLESALGIAGEEGAGIWGRKKAKGTCRSRASGKKGRNADLLPGTPQTEVSA